ncbi:MAG: hypothetical protein IJ209_03035 [Bacteroidaceae bacterium]|nr:hypothetical protein [Bacteroidaceae bacterium]
MVKRFTFFLLAASFVLGAWAQSAVFRYHGSDLANGATVTIYAEEDEYGDVVCESNPSSNPANGLVLSNLTSNALNGTASLVISSNTMAPMRVQWCMGSECMIFTSDRIDNKSFTVPANGYTLTQFDAYYPDQFGEINATLTAQVGFQRLTVNIRFVNADPASPLTFERRSVVEEYTGTWCGNCTSGMAAMELMEQSFGDRFIGIAVHTGSGEPMNNSAYSQAGLVPESVPRSTVDRGEYVNSYRGSSGAARAGIVDDVAAALAVPAEAGVDISAKWNEAEQKRIACTVETTFGFDASSAPYAIAIVITEDGLHGTGSAWMQENYYSHEYSGTRELTGPEMDVYWEAPRKIEGLIYNHVAVASLGVKRGQAGSVKAPIVKGQAQTYEASVAVVGNTIIQDKNNLTAIAMLINTETGRVVNAAKTRVLPFGADGVESLSLTSESLNKEEDGAVYDLIGRRLGNGELLIKNGELRRGVYIRGGKKYIIR